MAEGHGEKKKPEKIYFHDLIRAARVYAVVHGRDVMVWADTPADAQPYCHQYEFVLAEPYGDQGKVYFPNASHTARAKGVRHGLWVPYDKALKTVMKRKKCPRKSL